MQSEAVSPSLKCLISPGARGVRIHSCHRLSPLLNNCLPQLALATHFSPIPSSNSFSLISSSLPLFLKSTGQCHLGKGSKALDCSFLFHFLWPVTYWRSRQDKQNSSAGPATGWDTIARDAFGCRKCQHHHQFLRCRMILHFGSCLKI